MSAHDEHKALWSVMVELERVRVPGATGLARECYEDMLKWVREQMVLVHKRICPERIEVGPDQYEMQCELDAGHEGLHQTSHGAKTLPHEGKEEGPGDHEPVDAILTWNRKR
jgi:hypothetical protein